MIDSIPEAALLIPLWPVSPPPGRYARPVEDKPTEKTETKDRSEISPEARSLYEQSLILGSGVPQPGPVEKSSPEKKDQKSGNSGKKEKGSAKTGGKELSEEEKKEVARLQKTDMEVKAHEAAHLAAAGGLAGGASYEYEKGPDGKQYAVGGEVPISSGGGNTPEERLQNAQRVQRAALAPANPSSQDRSIASEASANALRARTEMAEEQNTPASSTNTPPNPLAPSMNKDSSAPVSSVWQKAVSAYQEQDRNDSSASKTIPSTETTSSLSTSPPRSIDIQA